MEKPLLPLHSVHTGLVEGYSAEGLGIVRLNGAVVFVPGAVRGETVDVEITKVMKSAAAGRIAAIRVPSSARAEPECPYFGLCGGCDFQHLTYEEELDAKRRRVQDALTRIGGSPVQVEEILGSASPIRYRNKSQYPVGSAGTGFYQARSHRVVPVERCLIQTEASDLTAGAVTSWMRRYQVPAYDELSGRGLLRHVYVRVNAQGESLCCVVANGKRLPREPELAAMILAAAPKTAGVVLNVNTARTNVILGSRYRVIWGRDYLMDTLRGREFKLSVPSFYQVNREQAEVLYGKALEFAALTGRETVLDLYCGAGTITLCLADRARRVIGAELVPEAIRDARENAARNGVENVEFFQGDAAAVAADLARQGLRPEVVTVDPPRKGLAPEVIASIAGMAPDRVVYVSCDPATLGRDVKRFADLGYEAARAAAVDMFPRTRHVETVLLLSQQKPDDHIVVDLDLDELDATSAETRATYEEIKAYVLEKHGLKVSSLYISQVKRKCGLEVGESYHLPKTEGQKVPQCPAAKEEAILDALRHFKMI